MPKAFINEGLQVSAQPFPHFSIDHVFSDQLANRILIWLKDTQEWSYTQTSFYTQYEFSLLDCTLPRELSILLGQNTVEQIKTLFGTKLSCGKLDLVGLTVHKLIDGHKMGVHNDFIGKAESHRLVIQLNESWNEDNGGFLMLFHSSDPSDVASIVRPLHNSAIGFEISGKSYHAVSAVRDFERYTLVYTFNESI